LLLFSEARRPFRFLPCFLNVPSPLPACISISPSAIAPLIPDASDTVCTPFRLAIRRSCVSRTDPNRTHHTLTSRLTLTTGTSRLLPTIKPSPRPIPSPSIKLKLITSNIGNRRDRPKHALTTPTPNARPRETIKPPPVPSHSLSPLRQGAIKYLPAKAVPSYHPHTASLHSTRRHHVCRRPERYNPSMPPPMVRAAPRLQRPAQPRQLPLEAAT
jgi:hypothetical protein